MSETKHIEAQLKFEGLENIPVWAINKKVIRRAYRTAGNVVRKEARKKINRKGGVAGYPKKQTGRMVNSLWVRVGSRGMYAKVMHKMPSPPSKWKQGLGFYPAFLAYGTKRGLRARDNWIVDTMMQQEKEIQKVLAKGFEESLE